MLRANTKPPPLPIPSQAAGSVSCSLLVTDGHNDSSHEAGRSNSKVLPPKCSACFLHSLSAQDIYRAQALGRSQPGRVDSARGTRHTVTTGAILSENTRRFSPVTGVQVALGQPVADHGKSFRVAVQLREGETTRCRSETASWALARSDFQVSFGNVSVQAQGPLTGDLTGGAQMKSLKGLWQS